MVREHVGHQGKPLSEFEIEQAEALEYQFHAPATTLGISPHDLTEGLARFWDVLVTGPDITYMTATGTEASFLKPEMVSVEEPGLDDFHHEMSVKAYPDFSGGKPSFELDQYQFALIAESRYAIPYQEVCAYAIRQHQSMVAFPLLAHFSLQTRDPVAVFTECLHTLPVLLGRRKSEPNANLLSALFARNFSVIRNYVGMVARNMDLRLVDSLDVIRYSRLGLNPIYLHYLNLLINVDKLHSDRLSYWFAVPGWERGNLASLVQAPVTRLIGGRWRAEAPVDWDYFGALLGEDDSLWGSVPDDPVWRRAPVVSNIEELFEYNADRAVEIAEISDEIRFRRLLKRKEDTVANSV